jgi:WXG100 family type VII secretion target
MSGYSIDTDALQERISEMTSFEKTLERQLADLDRAISQLHITWIGEAAAAHREAHTTWRKGADDMKKAIAAMRDAARIAHGNYHSAVAANTRMWESVR